MAEFFINPWLLAGAGFVALPIVLHLIMRQKPRLLEFPALRFIRRRHDANRRKLRWRHLLLLALRVLLIVLLATALARPKTKVAGGVFGGQKAPVAAALVFDTSKRMEYRHENRTRLEAAQELGAWLLGQLPPESQVAVLDSRLSSSSFQVDLGAARHRIEKLETTSNAQPLTSMLDEALRVVGQSELDRKEIYVFTDLARAAWPADAAPTLKRRIAETPDVGAYLIDVGVSDPVNFALGDLRPASQVLSKGSPLEIETEIDCQGPGGQRSVELYLLEPDPNAKDVAGRKPQRRDAQMVTLQPNQTQQIQFRVEGLGLGTHQGYVQILGQDGLADDDCRYFTVEVRPAPKILLAAPKPAARNAAFLYEALAPSAFRRSGRARFDVTVVALDDLLKQTLDPYAAVGLIDPTPLAAEVWRALGDFASAGHGVAIFLGRNADKIESFNEPAAQEILPGKLVRQSRAPEGDAYLAPRDFQHPMLATFRGYAAPVPWDFSPVFRYWQLGELQKGASVVISFRDHGAAVLERPLGRGRVVTVTTPVSDDPNRDPWNLLLTSDAPWPFMILANDMMNYLAGGGEQRLNYFSGQTAVLDLNPQPEFRSYILTGPSGDEIRLSPDLQRHVLVAPSADPPGNYRVQAGGAEGGVDRGFSVNTAAEQTRLQRIAEPDLAKLLDPLHYRIAQGRDQIELNVTTGRVGRELFPFFILAAAVLLAMEHLVANRFYRE
ncbi:MAG: BatA domain-containing protein [Thermoguttaceae bacterium]